MRTFKTLVGEVNCLVIRGEWGPDFSKAYVDHACDAIEWYASDQDRSSSPLLEFRESLVFLRIASPKKMSDAVLAQLPHLRFVHAETRGSDALDFRNALELVHLAIDDRREIQNLIGPALQKVTFSLTRRGVSFFSQIPRLQSLKLQMIAKSPVDLAADMPELESLLVLKGTIESFVGLNAPKLRSLTLDGVHTTGRLDLGPLADLPELSDVTVSCKNPTEVDGLARLQARPEVRLSIGTG